MPKKMPRMGKLNKGGFFKIIFRRTRRSRGRNTGGTRLKGGGIRPRLQQSYAENYAEKNAPHGIRTRITGSEDQYSIQLS